MTFSEGDVALLQDRQGRGMLVNLAPGRQFHTHRGSIRAEDLIGRTEGTAVRTSMGDRVLAFRPRLMDYTLEMARSTGLVYPKDAAFLLMWADIFPGARVVEAGIGSGALTLSLLRAIGPAGMLVSYELRADFIARAIANLERFLGVPPTLLVRERDIYEGILETDIDRVVLDLPEPWRVIHSAAAALRPGGIFCSYNPSIVQVQRTAEALREHGGFAALESIEVLYRPWVLRGDAVRPEQQMIGHTGFLTFARRLASETTALE
jgi:tRNA (adenine57-N1/adenine58-N1)-methyltransferase